MAEAFGIVTGIIGLLPICANGCFFIESICTAHRGVEEQKIRVQLQRRNLRAWGYVWEIPATIPTRKSNSKLQRWIDRNPPLAGDVLDTLSDISNLFADVINLEKSYGILLDKKDPALRDMTVRGLLSNRKDVGITRKDVERRRQHMNIIDRCRFQLSGTDKFDKLVSRLIEFIQSLRDICSEQQAAQIDRAFPSSVSANRDPQSLEMVSKVYGEEADRRRRAGQRSPGAELVRDVAAFKARVQKQHAKRMQIASQRRQVGSNKAFLLSGAFCEMQDFGFPSDIIPSLYNPVRLAMDMKTCKSRYVEYKRYADIEGQANPLVENDILELSDFLHVSDRPDGFRVMPCLGIFRDEQNSRFGFLYQPPRYVENVENRRQLKGEAAKQRVPESLLDMLRRGTERGGSSSILPLGHRFQLARTLAQCLYVLHATGWVHKNIRSSSVIFTPAESSLGGVPSTSGVKDISNPYLCGFGHSRPADRQKRHNPNPPKTPDRPNISTQAWNITLDEYHHPAKQDDESLPYIQAFDLYSLGAVLLELGLWQPLALLPRSRRAEPAEFRLELMRIARDELPGQVGEIYANVVTECLGAGRRYTDAQTQDVLCWKVAAALDECKA